MIYFRCGIRALGCSWNEQRSRETPSAYILSPSASLEPGLASSPAEEGSPQGKNVHKCDFESPSRRLAVTASLEPGLASSPAEEGSPQGKNVHKCDFESPSRRLAVTGRVERRPALLLSLSAAESVQSQSGASLPPPTSRTSPAQRASPAAVGGMADEWARQLRHSAHSDRAQSTADSQVPSSRTRHPTRLRRSRPPSQCRLRISRVQGQEGGQEGQEGLRSNPLLAINVAPYLFILFLCINFVNWTLAIYVADGKELWEKLRQSAPCIAGKGTVPSTQTPTYDSTLTSRPFRGSIASLAALALMALAFVSSSQLHCHFTTTNSASHAVLGST